jgi:hypothetical protein
MTSVSQMRSSTSSPPLSRTVAGRSGRKNRGTEELGAGGRNRGTKELEEEQGNV